jgi:hypothetical protein
LFERLFGAFQPSLLSSKGLRFAFAIRSSFSNRSSGLWRRSRVMPDTIKPSRNPFSSDRDYDYFFQIFKEHEVTKVKARLSLGFALRCFDLSNLLLFSG